MKKVLKSSLSLFLAITIIFSSAYVGLAEIDFSEIKFDNPFAVKSKATSVDDLDLIYGTDDGITRAEWLHNLVVVFDMTIEDESLPDNYFSDLTEEHEYYSDIILAVDFGVVDIEAGGELRPDDYVTRDFAASTLNFCLGYQLDEGAEYTFTDYESCSSPDSAQIAVDRGWLKLSDGCFAPDTLVTSDETEDMFKDAVNVLEESVVDTDYDSTFDFADDVIVVEKGTAVSEGENGVVSITDCPETISAGDKFAVYHGELPCVYVAETVKVENGITKITTSVVEAEEAYTNVDAQGQADADAMELIPADDVEISFEEEPNPVATFASGSKTISTINVKKTITLTNAAKATVSVKIKNPVVEYSVNNSYAYVALNGKTEINYGIKMDMLTATGTSKQIKLFTCNVAGVGSFDVNINLSCEGSASGNVTGYLTAGIECVKGDHIRAVKGFTQSQYYTNVEATANVGLRASLGVTHLPFVDASIYAEVGANARISSTTYSGATLPKKCTHFSAYMYALYGAYASVDFGVWSKTFSKSYEIFGYSNSPVRIVHHYEDGMIVPKCTRGTSYANFFTNGYSHWSGSGWMGANGAYGLYGDGTYFPLYDYTLDEDNNATITKYNGNSWSVYIPEDIDGYTVTAIGDSAFYGKNAHFISIPDTVTRIEEYAFRNCYYLTNITIPNTVTYIGNYVFDECISLSDITIPSNLEIINTGVFYGCSSLRDVTIPDSVTEIDDLAFGECVSLKYVLLSKNLIKMGGRAFKNTAIESIEIPNSLEVCEGGWSGSYTFDDVKYPSFNQGPFALCEKLKTVTFETGTTQIAKSLFAGCTGLEIITIPSTVTLIESNAFMDCFRLKEVTIPDSVTEIQDSAFYRCVSLPKVIIPDSVTEMGDGVFENSTSLKDVTLSKSLVTLGSHVFAGTIIETIEIPKSIDSCSTGWSGADYEFENVTYEYFAIGPFARCEKLESVTFEKGTKQIAQGLFGGCSGLEKIVIPDTVIVIESSAFKDCLSLQEVTIPDSVTEIQSSAFNRCVSLSKVIIPDSVTKIGSSAFEDCTSLKDVTLSKSLVTLGSHVFSGTIIESIEIPKSIDSCSTGWSGADYEFENVTYEYFAIGPFARCEKLKTATFEDGTKQIAQGLFGGCSGLEKIVIPDTVIVIESSAFKDCLSLQEVTIPDSVTEIQSNAFNRCVSLFNVTIPDSVTVIGSNLFEDCSSLENAKLSKYIEMVSTNMFSNCKSLKTIEVPANVERIFSEAFYGCVSLGKITFACGSKLYEISDEAFYGCSSLKEINLPEKIKRIYSNSFQNCVALEKINIPEYVEYLGSAAFKGCENLTTVNIADYSIEEIDAKTFSDCPGLKKIVLPKGLTKIGSQAFMNNTGLTEVVIPESVTSIDSTAFSYPAKTTIYGKAGSYAETFATEGGFKFEDNNVPIEGIILKGGLENITLDEGETYHAEFEVYPEDANEVITLTADSDDVWITGHNIYAYWCGDAKITATTSNGLSYEFNVHIRRANSISITKQPTKLSYIMGESLDLTGMEVQVNYNDDSVKTITDYTVSGFDSAVEGTSTVTVQWVAANGSKYTTTFDVEIVDPTPKVTGIFIETLPTKVQYELREKLDLTGMVVKANYTDGSVKEIIDYTTSGYNALKNAAQVITVTYKDFTTTFTVYVGVVACSHSSTKWVTDQEATVYKAGSKHKECTECGEVLDTTTIKQLKCAKPVLKKVYNANSYVKVTWGTVKGADLYRVYRKTGTGEYEYIGSTKNTYYNDKEAGAGKTCRYIVKAKNEAGNSVASASIAVIHIDEPTLKSIENSAYGVLIKWDKVTGAEKYNIYRKVSGGEYEYIGATSNTYYTDKTAKSGTKYYYAIRGKRDDSVSSQSASLSKYHLAEPTLKTIENSAYGVLIKWDNVTGAEKYSVYRKVSGGEYEYIGATTNTYYTDKTAESGTKYYYEVRAKKGETVSALSSAKSIYHLADTTLKTPTSTTSGIKLSWSKVTGAEGYMVYRKTGSGSYTKLATVKGSTKVTYTDSSAKKGKKYTYKIKVYKSKTYSAYSNTKTITDKY